MRNRRICIMAFLLIAAICLGLGYAAVMDDLYIGGTASIDIEGIKQNFKNNVHWVDAVATTYQANPNSGIAISAKIQIIADFYGEPEDAVAIIVDGFSAVEDKVVVKATMINESQGLDVTVNLPSVVNYDGTKVVDTPFVNDYYAVSARWAAGMNPDADGNIVIKSGETADVLVTIEVTQISAELQNANFAMVFNVVAIETSA